jgi:hypothetical protein
MQVKTNDPFAGAWTKVCPLRAIIAESVAAIKGTGSDIVKDWEERQDWGAVAAGGTDRYGWRAVYQTWKTLAWLLVLDIENIGVKKFKGEYAKRFRALTKGELEGRPTDAEATIAYHAATIYGVRKTSGRIRE